MANTRISDLTASASNLASTDLAPVVQTAGVGPVKMTGLQLAGGLLGSATFNGATVTTSQPVLNLTQTWNDGAVTFTGLKFNATDTASASGSLLLDLQVGGSSKFKVDKAGNVTAVSDTVSVINATSQISLNNTSIGLTNSAATLANNIPLGWSSSGVWYGTVDTILTRGGAAATLQLGAADAAAPVAQTFKVQSVVGSTPGATDVAGANFTIQGSAGRGSGAGGSIIFQVAPAGSAGTGAQNAYSTALTIASDQTATLVGNLTVPRVIATNGLVFGSGGNALLGSSAFVSFFISSSYAVYASSTYNSLTVDGSYKIGWASSAANAPPDTVLVRDATNTLALRNGTNAQTFNVYNTYTSSTNYERFTINAQSGNSVLIGTNKGSGGGTARALELQTDGTTALTLTTAQKAEFAASIKTAAPTTGTAAEWKLGSRVAATTLLDTTQYIELDVGGTLYKLAVVTS